MKDGCNERNNNEGAQNEEGRARKDARKNLERRNEGWRNEQTQERSNRTKERRKETIAMSPFQDFTLTFLDI